MDSTSGSAPWDLVPPQAWPSAPKEMTVTTLSEITACPRRWALATADYAGLWNGHGYPPRVSTASLAGTVVHMALERIVRQFVRNACAGVQHAKATMVLKELGGYTKVVQECIDIVLQRLIGNPRAALVLENTTRTLRTHAPELRTRVQVIVSRLRLPVSKVASSESGRKQGGPLTRGAFPEIVLRARQIGWKGKVDLLVLSDGTCEIIDFKTGEPDEAHAIQLKIYALLWSRDKELNPAGRLADRLVLAYPGGDAEVAAPKHAELEVLENQILAQRDTAHRALSQSPPEARPSAQTCRYCGVRQLCDRYWLTATQAEISAHRSDQSYVDAEVLITTRHGSSSWDAVVVHLPGATAGRPALVRTSSPMEFRAGARIRVLDGAVAREIEDDCQPVVITLGMYSEAYFVA